MEPIVSDTFKNLFPRNSDILESIKEDMKKNGFRESQPIIVAKGPWTNPPCVIDGHTRLEAAKSLDIEPTFTVHYFATQQAALEFALYLQAVRRNLTDAEIMSCVSILDVKKVAGRPSKKLSSNDDNSNDRGSSKGKSSEYTAKLLNISSRKVEKIRAILSEDTPEEIKENVFAGKKSINRAEKEIRQLKKKNKTLSKSATSEGPGDSSGSIGTEDVIGVTSNSVQESQSNPDEKDDSSDDSKESPVTTVNILPLRTSIDSRVDSLIARIHSLPTITEKEEALSEFESVLNKIETRLSISSAC